MGIVSRLIANCRRWIRRLSPWSDNKGEQFNWPTGTFVSLDPDRIADDLKLIEKAELNGTLNLPTKTDTIFDGPQQEVRVEINSGVANTIADANVRVAEFTKQIRAVNVESDVRSLQELPGALRRSIESWLETEDINDALPQLRQTFESAKEALQRFKQRHGLVRPPMAVERGFWTTVILFSLMLQVLVNANFFANAHPQGFLGGVIYAGLFAFLDVVVAFLLGNGVRQCNRRELLYRVRGWISVSLALFWCLCFNLFVAHYRVAMQSPDFLKNPAFDPFATAYMSIVEAPFRLTDLSTVLLFAFGQSNIDNNENGKHEQSG